MPEVDMKGCSERNRTTLAPGQNNGWEKGTLTQPLYLIRMISSKLDEFPTLSLAFESYDRNL